MRALWSNPWRLTLLLISASIISLAAALFAVDRIGESIIDGQARAAATAEQNFMVTLEREEGLAALVATLNRRERVHGGAGFRYALTDANGHALAGASALRDAHMGAKGWKVVPSAGHDGQKIWHVLVGTLPNGEQLYIAQDSEQRADFRRAIFEASGFAILFVSLACTLAGLLLSGYLLRRAGQISRTAEQIAAGNLSARVDVHAHGDAFDRLGTALNAMLLRIEELMTGMRTITDSMAHDLRRPLSRVQNALERAADAGTSAEDRLDAIAEARLQNDNALATFSALLDIARAESGLSAEAMSDVDVAALLCDVAELFEPMFEDARQAFRPDIPDGPMPIRAHELLLRQAVGNLLHNAALHGGAGVSIALSATRVEHGIDIVVADSGAGIPESDRGRVQQRFVRLDAARSAPGTGLGLAIAAACAKLHGGRLLLEDNHPGLRVVLELRST